MKYVLLILVWIFGAGCTVEQKNESENDDMSDVYKKGWSASGSLRQTDVHKEVSLQVVFPDPGNYTCQFRLDGDLRFKKAVAEITWTVEGNQIRRMITISDGVSIQGAAQAVAVKIKDISVTPINPANANPDYLAFVSVVKGTRGSTGSPPTYDTELPVTVAAAGGAASWPVPKNAGVTSVAFQVYRTGTNPLRVAGEQYDAATALMAIYDVDQFFWQPLAPGCTDVAVENLGVDDIKVRPVFGIDG